MRHRLVFTTQAPLLPVAEHDLPGMLAATRRERAGLPTVGLEGSGCSVSR